MCRYMLRVTLVRGYANSMVKDFPFWVRNSEPAPEVVPNAPPIKVGPHARRSCCCSSRQAAAGQLAGATSLPGCLHCCMMFFVHDKNLCPSIKTLQAGGQTACTSER